MSTIAVLVAGVVVLGACGQRKTVEAQNATVGEVGAKVAQAGIQFHPGAWETTIRTMDVSVEGMPPEMADAMKQAMTARATGEANKTRNCLTPEKAAKPDAEFFGKENKDCRYKDFSMGGGKIAANLVCSGEHGHSTVTMNGVYTPDSYTMDINVGSTMGPEDGMAGKAMKMHVVAESRHVGECKPDDVRE
ncbi:hypothetical protein Y88_3826 [Novosphingobium nitrogenifigens DSM 19370]|uniref:DUF3617 domain-containing protein n=1 Tax=Novosphingobium nitrogenifigens DSM 19370 TaxID=983920 RepID=F1ZCZ7_9SPHN|nr:DUF3617 domain-containing protein [Novosphingobium nitrogenifigens]EGD57516.1 hypothetical protein Y88_3826 [Novosphingobium nitrogenifigens DSM 19370]